MVARNTTRKTQYNYREQVEKEQVEKERDTKGATNAVIEDYQSQLKAAYLRIDELLQANNEYLARARAAEQLAYQRLTGLTGQAMIIGQLGTELAMTQEDD